MVDGLFVEKLSRNDTLDDLLENLFAELFGRDAIGVLSGNNDGVDAERDDSAAIALVLDGNLGLRVGTKPRKSTGTASDGHGLVQLVGQDDGKRHVLFSLVGGIAEHDTLVTGTVVLKRTFVETLRNIGRLLFNGDKNVASLVVESLLGVIVTDLLDGLANDLLVVDLGLGGNLTKDHDHAGLGCRLASDLAAGVLSKAGVELPVSRN